MENCTQAVFTDEHIDYLYQEFEQKYPHEDT